MYSDIKSIQIVVALLKKYNIKHLVLSAGSRHTPFVRSVENDPFFTCYSIVDERSAGFFALGLIQELNEPVAIACTSGTSVSNYVSAVSEAYYASLPLVVVSIDRNQYYLNQQEEQMVPQHDALKSVCKKSVVLPIVKDEKDEWCCNRLVNEALLELDHHGKGPVHIDVPVEDNLFDFSTDKLPNVVKIDRVLLNEEQKWKQKAKELNGKKILVTYGQSAPIEDDKKVLLEEFAKKYNAIYMVEHLSNLHCYGTVKAYNVIRTRYETVVSQMVPDVVIAMNGNVVEIRAWLNKCTGQYKFWNVLENGAVSDPLRCLDTVFECNAYEFIEKMVKHAPEKQQGGDYYQKWLGLADKMEIPELGYSDLYACRELTKNIPKNSLLHLANSNSVRLPQHFTIDPSVKIYCNRGTNGIDGSMSTFMGQACLHDGQCFLLIGDLSFFYDMNGLWNKYICKNIRIMLNNNSCGEIFYMNKRQDKSTVGRHIAAAHETSAEAWVRSRGFKYLRSTNKDEFDANLKEFLREDSNMPVFFEVMTDKNENCKQMDKFVSANAPKNLKSSVKNIIKKVLGR